MEVYQFVPSKTLTDLNTRLDEAGSELHLELDFGDDGNGEDDGDDENPAAVMARIAPELDLANVGQEFDPSDVDRQRPKKAHQVGYAKGWRGGGRGMQQAAGWPGLAAEGQGPPEQLELGDGETSTPAGPCRVWQGLVGPAEGRYPAINVCVVVRPPASELRSRKSIPTRGPFGLCERGGARRGRAGPGWASPLAEGPKWCVSGRSASNLQPRVCGRLAGPGRLEPKWRTAAKQSSQPSLTLFSFIFASFLQSGSPANAVPQGALGQTEAPGTTPPPTTPNPALSPEQLQQLTLLRYLNPQAAAALGPHVITTSKPVLKYVTQVQREASYPVEQALDPSPFVLPGWRPCMSRT